MTPSERLNRRDVLLTAAGVGAAMLASPVAPAAPGGAAGSKPLRFVHITDIHVPDEDGGAEGFASALDSISRLDPKPDFIVTGGDHVMEALDCPRGRALEQWAIYRKTLAAGTKLPIRPVLGNHDIWGWGIENRDIESVAGYGKAMALDQLGLKSAWYSFDAGGWHFVALDSMTRRGRGYFGSLDPEQMQWLKGELAATPKGTPICVLSHIPILCACAFFDGERLRPDHWQVPDAWMHRDAAALVELMGSASVKLLVSGHIHLYDKVEYNAMTFVCDGALSGAWWKGPYHETPAGFGVFDLYPDGRFTNVYRALDWKPKPG